VYLFQFKVQNYFTGIVNYVIILTFNEISSWDFSIFCLLNNPRIRSSHYIYPIDLHFWQYFIYL